MLQAPDRRVCEGGGREGEVGEVRKWGGPKIIGMKRVQIKCTGFISNTALLCPEEKKRLYVRAFDVCSWNMPNLFYCREVQSILQSARRGDKTRSEALQIRQSRTPAFSLTAGKHRRMLATSSAETPLQKTHKKNMNTIQFAYLSKSDSFCLFQLCIADRCDCFSVHSSTAYLKFSLSIPTLHSQLKWSLLCPFYLCSAD